MDEVKPVEKTSAWTDAERDRSAEVAVPAPPERPELPPWLSTFHPHSTFEYNGWECVVRHVGYEGGMWMMLVEPVSYTEPRGAKRAAYRQARKTPGKKAAKKLLATQFKTTEVVEQDAGA